METSNQAKWKLTSLPLAGFIFAVTAIFLISCGSYASQVSLDLGINGTTDDFTYLAQYGTWINVEPYGTVWSPSVMAGWRPFTHGHWVWSDEGWAWVSYEPFGWLVFHYGNWDYEPSVGWFWIEGSIWSAAPVEWLDYDGYIAWAPLPPPGIAWPDPWDHPRFHIWNMVHDRDFDRANIGHYRIGNEPRPRGGEVYHRPLGIQDFDRITGKNTRPERIQHGSVPVFMTPPNQENRDHRQPYANQHETRRPEQKHPEISQPEQRRGEYQPPEHRQGESHGNENRPPEQPQGEMRGNENRPPEQHQGEMRGNENRPPEQQQGEMHGSDNRVQLHRMELPEKDQAKIRKYRPQVEHKVMRPVRNDQQQKPREEKSKRKK